MRESGEFRDRHAVGDASRPDSDDSPTTPVSADALPWRSGSDSFRAGDLVSGRYRIKRLLGRGGMGDVYEAHDLELDDLVALKTVRAGGDERAVSRFRREAQLARRITHPNVSRIFDVGTHRLDDRAEKVLFVTMELLRGETLASRIARAGRLTVAEALPIVRDVCHALTAAHAAGIIHRDMKTSNVMLVDESASNPRAVVTDFGVARAAELIDGRLTDTGEIMGTPAYIAPEQLEAAPVTPATDIYSLGVVMFEMLSGAMPFEAPAPVLAAMMRLREPPRRLRDVVPDVDARWDQVIARCLERHPEDRFTSAAEVLSALEHPDAPLRRPSRRVRRTAAYAAIGAAVLAAVSFFLLRDRDRSADVMPERRSAVSVRVRPGVAILGFRDLTPDPSSQWLATAFSEMLTTELLAGEQLRAIGGDEVERVRRDLDLATGVTHARETLQRIRGSLSVEYLVTGTYLVAGGEGGRRIRLDVRLQETASGETVGSFSESAPESDIIELVGRAGSRLREVLGVGPLPDGLAAARVSLPADERAARHYIEGIEQLRRRDAPKAAAALQEAVRREPKFPLAHSALAEAWRMMGYDGRATEAARAAFELAAGLPREERLQVEARYRVTAREWDAAERIYRSLTTFFPDNIEYGLQLVDVQVSSGRAKEAAETIASLRTIPPPAGRDPRIDLAAATVGEGLGDFELQRSSAASAAARAEPLGARSLVAEARLQEAWALEHLSRRAEAERAFDEAERLFSAAGDRNALARIWRRRSIALRNAGDINGAIAMAERALAVYRETGDRLGAANSLGIVAMLRSALGQVEPAHRSLQQSLAEYREIGDRQNEAWALGAIGTVHLRQGNLRQGEDYFRRSIEVAHEIGDRHQEGVSAHNLAELHSSRGRLEDAATYFASALDLLGSDPSSRAYVLSGLAGVDLARGALAEARARAQEALEIRKSIDEPYALPESLARIAEIELERGELASARTNVDAAIEQAVRQKRSNVEAAARLMSSRVAIAARQLDLAAQELERARAAASGSGEDDLLHGLVIAESELAAARQQSDAALLSRLERTIRSARKQENLSTAFAAEIAAARLELAAGHRAEANRRLLRTEQEAQRNGFGLIVRRAAQLRR